MVAFLAIALGVILIIMFNPPTTLCDTQMEVLVKSQQGFLTPDPNSKLASTSGFARQYDQCKATNAPGGCYQLFLHMRKLLDDLDKVPRDCTPEVPSKGTSGSDAVKPALFKTIELLVQIAWGEKPPRSYSDKLGWLEPIDLSLFCNLKKKAQELYGKEVWLSFQEKQFTALPGSEQMNRKQVWQGLLLSVNCSKYF